MDSPDITELLKFHPHANSLPINNVQTTVNHSGLQLNKKQKTDGNKNGKQNDKYLNQTVNVSTVVQQNIEQNLKNYNYNYNLKYSCIAYHVLHILHVYKCTCMY